MWRCESNFPETRRLKTHHLLPCWGAGRGQPRRVKQFLRPASRPGGARVPFGLAQMKWNISTLTVAAQRTAPRAGGLERITGSTNGRVAFHSAASTSRLVKDTHFHSLWTPHYLCGTGSSPQITQVFWLKWKIRVSRHLQWTGQPPPGKGDEPGNEAYECRTGSNGCLDCGVQYR